jgi:hypothetical protein
MYEYNLRITQRDGTEHRIVLDLPSWMLDPTDKLALHWDRITELALMTPDGYPIVVFGTPLMARNPFLTLADELDAEAAATDGGLTDGLRDAADRIRKVAGES